MISVPRTDGALERQVSGVTDTGAVVLIAAPSKPTAVTLDGKALETFDYSADHKLGCLRFKKDDRPRRLWNRQ